MCGEEDLLSSDLMDVACYELPQPHTSAKVKVAFEARAMHLDASDMVFPSSMFSVY